MSGVHWFRWVTEGAGREPGAAFRGSLGSLCPELLTGALNHEARIEVGMHPSWCPHPPPPFPPYTSRPFPPSPQPPFRCADHWFIWPLHAQEVGMHSQCRFIHISRKFSPPPSPSARGVHLGTCLHSSWPLAPPAARWLQRDWACAVPCVPHRSGHATLLSDQKVSRLPSASQIIAKSSPSPFSHL